MIIYPKPTANVRLNGESLRSEMRKGCTFITFIQHSTSSPSESNQKEEKTDMQIRNKGSKIIIV